MGLYDHVGDGTYETVTWEYAICPLTPNGGTTVSIKPAGTVKVGDRLPGADHMTAIKVGPF